jgi:hypothetical protein
VGPSGRSRSRGPGQLGVDEAGGVDLDEDVVGRRLRVGASARVIAAVPAAWSVTAMPFTGESRFDVIRLKMGAAARCADCERGSKWCDDNARAADLQLSPGGPSGAACRGGLCGGAEVVSAPFEDISKSRNLSEIRPHEFH